jgi:RNA polymerase subunit RPABC4/transcription elongation factor Spt4
MDENNENTSHSFKIVNEKICDKCDKYFKKNYKFCPKCGAHNLNNKIETYLDILPNPIIGEIGKYFQNYNIKFEMNGIKNIKEKYHIICTDDYCICGGGSAFSIYFSFNFYNFKFTKMLHFIFENVQYSYFEKLCSKQYFENHYEKFDFVCMIDEENILKFNDEIDINNLQIKTDKNSYFINSCIIGTETFNINFKLSNYTNQLNKFIEKYNKNQKENNKYKIIIKDNIIFLSYI